MEQNETIVKELCIAVYNVVETFQFQSAYGMTPQGNSENGLKCDDGHVPYTVGLCSE